MSIKMNFEKPFQLIETYTSIERNMHVYLQLKGECQANGDGVTINKKDPSSTAPEHLPANYCLTISKRVVNNCNKYHNSHLSRTTMVQLLMQEHSYCSGHITQREKSLGPTEVDTD